MLHLRKRTLETVEDVRAALLGAVRLELSTIPPYLTALYSIVPGANSEVAGIIRSVAIEEMLHMCLACNILNAVGGQPAITAPGFNPTYPGPLPMGIGSEPGKPFIVPLKKLSPDLVQTIFMTIEEPEDPLHFPVVPLTEAVVPEYHTIGEFYLSIRDAIVQLGNAIFTGDPKLQVTGWFPSSELFAVTDVKSASRAIETIILQGEGTKTTPVDFQGQLAHYYLFAEIVNGRHLVLDPKQPLGYSYSGAPIPFDPAGIYPMVDNPPLVQLPAGSLVARYANQFDETYSSLLNALHATVNGRPDQLDAAIGLMYTLRIEAQQLMSTPIPGMTDVNAGPRWQYTAELASA